MRFLDALTLSISVCSLVSSALYTYAYVVGQRATFFNQVQSDFAKAEMREAFDVLEGFLDATGPQAYASEYVRLKGLQRAAYRQEDASGKGKLLVQAFMPSLHSQPSEVQVGQIIIRSRRRILHFWGMLLSLHRMGYITRDMMLEFPGRSRALHAVQLLQPLVGEISVALKISGVASGLQEHSRILEDLRSVYDISQAEASAYSAYPAQVCNGGDCVASDATSDNWNYSHNASQHETYET